MRRDMMTRSRDARRKALRKQHKEVIELIKREIKKERGITISDKQAVALFNGANNASDENEHDV
jgi:hypothetical protein